MNDFKVVMIGFSIILCVGFLCNAAVRFKDSEVLLNAEDTRIATQDREDEQEQVWKTKHPNVVSRTRYSVGEYLITVEHDGHWFTGDLYGNKGHWLHSPACPNSQHATP